jgi:hypothetical protein
LPIDFDKRNTSEYDLRCLRLNYQAYDILVNSLSEDVYFVFIPQNDLVSYAHYILAKIHEKYAKYVKLLSLLLPLLFVVLTFQREKKKDDRNQTMNPPHRQVCFPRVINVLLLKNSGDKSDDEEEYENDSEDETKSTSSQGTFSHTILHASAYNDDRENETEDVEEKELR